MKKIILIIAILVIGYFGYSYFSTPLSGDDEGGVQIVLIDEQGIKIFEDYYEFTEETSLYDLMRENYDIACADSNYHLDESCNSVAFGSHVILQIESVTTDWYTSFLEISIDDVPSQYGIDQIMITDDTTYTFRVTSLGGASN
jgi:hypothetical protein